MLAPGLRELLWAQRRVARLQSVPEVRHATTDAGAAVNLDNTAYERLFATQNPPYVDTWYREADLSAATAQ